jgi:tRNA A-37 threonylcarbamoyl transferase component Bud32
MLMSDSHAKWQLFVFPGWREQFHSVEKVLTLLSTPEKVLQDNARGMVCLIRKQDHTFIAKQSKIQENRRWAQFTSLYRKGEGSRMLRNMAQLFELGLPVPEPVLVLEKKRLGFVVASWSVYCYLEGQPCRCVDAFRIADVLKQIHQQGWVHRDPHVKNFLLHEGEIYIIDCAKARPWSFEYARMYDVVLLNNCCPGSLKGYGISDSYWVYRLAKAHNNLIKFWRKLKRCVRPKAYQKRES